MPSASRTTAYIVQPFWRDAKARLRAGKPVRRESLTLARRAAQEYGLEAAGVSILSLDVAPDVDWCGEPRLLVSFGEVPEVG